MRLIDADEVYKVLTDYYNHRTEIQHKALKEAIGRVPSVDAEPVKHGHWIDGNGNPVSWDDMNIGCPSDSCYCSECGDWLTASDEYPTKGYYCPNCGAKMDLPYSNYPRWNGKSMTDIKKFFEEVEDDKG